jgi:hypothetical protein
VQGTLQYQYNDWVTLEVPGITGHGTGESCAAGWFELHPWLEQYQSASCINDPAFETDTWNAASGRSPGWEEWTVDLSPWDGKQVEVSISYASDWATQGLGTFVDDIVVSTGEGSTSFEAGFDGWAVTGPPATRSIAIVALLALVAAFPGAFII